MTEESQQAAGHPEKSDVSGLQTPCSGRQADPQSAPTATASQLSHFGVSAGSSVLSHPYQAAVLIAAHPGNRSPRTEIWSFLIRLKALMTLLS